jgi:ABC-type lipoprotein export system ATPase subunit
MLNLTAKGSEWRKWDLHVHSPGTKMSDGYKIESGDIWDKFCDSIQNSDVEVIAITDYFSVENHFTFLEKFRAKYPDSKKVFFPNIELRLAVSVNKKAEEVNLHIIFADVATKAKIELFLSKLNTNITKDGAVVPCKDLSCKRDFESAGIEYTSLRKTLKEVFGEKNCYLIFAAANNAGLRPDSSSPRKLNVTDEIDKVCDGFFGGSQNAGFYLGTDRYENDEVAKRKPVISGCDAHSFDDLEGWLGKRSTVAVGDTKIIEKDVMWVKAELTFEGLKQIIYEPETRVSIGEEKPKKPINTINSITLQVPDGAKVGDDNFCFAGNKNTYDLSPYFNCFIGGRGSGKSTILNFLGLHSNNPDSSKQFWSDLKPSFDSNDNLIFSFQGTEIFEFLAQSEIETFARDKTMFTQAIYERANGPSKTLQTFEDDANKHQTELDKIIQAVIDLKSLVKQKGIKEKDKRSLESIKNIIESEEYNQHVDKISELTQKLQVHKKWANEVHLLRTQLDDTIEFYTKFLDGNDDKIKYKDSYLSAINKVKEAIEILDEKNFGEEKIVEKSHLDNLVLLEMKLKKILNKGDFSEDNIEQIKSAPQKIATLEQEIERIGFEIAAKDKIISNYNATAIKLRDGKRDYEEKITEILDPLQNLLRKQFEDNQGNDIKQISLEYSFNEKSAWESLTNRFYNHFQSQYGGSQRGKEVCEFIIENKENFSSDNWEEAKKPIHDKKIANPNAQYLGFLERVFEDQNNFHIFQAIRDKHLHDVSSNKIIKVEYDGKPVEQASFGQRCTAVVVILILFGNYPLIIDEPEAHLDSSLIANYLVPLLKEKKSDRQVIFATHNANFVINGDAEKIFILKNDTGKTNVIEATIEDVKNRSELLKLEGGKEAFEKRGAKLNIV